MDWRLREREVRVGLLGLHVIDARREGATGDGQTLLMLHGLGAHGHAWCPMIPALAGVDRVICPDQRGHGQSDWSRDGYWLHDYATDAKLLLDQLDVDQVAVVGHSLGARVAMVLAPMLAERLTSLALLDTGPELSRTAAGRPLPRGAGMRPAPGAGSEEELTALLRERHPDFTEGQLQIRARKLYRLNWAGMLVARTDPEVDWLLGAAGEREVEDAWAGLRATKVPTLVLRGTASPQLDDELSRRMVEALPGGQYQEIALGHSMHCAAPALVAEALNAFHTGIGT